jgi:hypothetical protein
MVIAIIFTWFCDVWNLLNAIASIFMVKNGQKMRFFGPKMTRFAVRSGPKQPKNRSQMHKTS